MNQESRIMNQEKKKSIIRNSLFMIRSRGFTLIELLLVIAVLGILAGGTLVAIDPIGKINSAKIAKAKIFSARLCYPSKFKAFTQRVW